jgi:hypothetical protein
MFKDKIVYVDRDHIHDLPAATKLPEITGDLKESLKALGNHPAFNYLLQRLRFERAAMQTALNEGLTLSETQLRYLQSGIYWASKLERDHTLLTQSKPVTRPATDDEADEFRRVRESLTLLDQQ